ncbi:uncharacterized protein LOC126870306 [Bombus huntii]|uniref:uncharacterized protein LOC126870306 n=1 Tax=Bombus huntii TaxID=85661 RepID=UPI0021AA56CD|nr:uncharacterized protein LOC126870306 [Bombus huntii]
MPSPTTLSPKWSTPTNGLKQNTILVDVSAAYKVDHLLSTQQPLGLAIHFPWQLRHLRTATTHTEPSILDRDAKSSHSRSKPNQTEGKMSLILSFAENWTTPVQPPIIIKKARYEWVSGGSPVPQSTEDLLHVFIVQPHTDFTCLCEIGELYNDTSWDEVSHDTSWAELFHDTSWFANRNRKSPGNADDHGDPERKEDNISSTHRTFDRIFEVTLATTASSRLPQVIRQRASWNDVPHSSSYQRANPIKQNKDNQQSTRSRAAAPINSTFNEILIGTLSTGGGCYARRLSAWPRSHTAGQTDTRCPLFRTAYPQ